ncbi:zinc finger protein 624-like isoform X2 [Myzus persicae]|uniref:zinc finger protein 624-like isoform X2 n=1 Tax=Myzus persicae TaxID=13164 RepID=UPI000B9348D6|nr:zinc finger protein 624-like isoform X2 [Myzus persicae]
MVNGEHSSPTITTQLKMTSPKKGTGRIQRTKVTTTMSKGSMSQAMMQLLHYQSLKVTNNLSNIQVTQRKIMPKEKTEHTASETSNEHMTAVIHLPCQSSTISNTNYSNDTRMVSQVEIMMLPVKETDCGTATISGKCTTDNMVVCDESFGTTTVAVDDKYETLVDSIKSKVGPYVCQICDKYFKYVSSLNEHEKRHKPIGNETQAGVVRSHVCEICGLAFKKIYTLTVHLRMHTGHKPFACKVCGDTFTCSANRSVHMRTHTGYRPYVCNVCGYAFNQSHVLTEHMRLHTGERPYECGLCKLVFVSSGLLRKHTVRKHNKHA